MRSRLRDGDLVLDQLLDRSVGVPITPAEARRLVREQPGRWRAAFVEAPGSPLLDHPQARVRLHPTVKAADEELRARRDGLVENGWNKVRGSFTYGYFVFERDGETVSMCVDKARRPK